MGTTLTEQKSLSKHQHDLKITYADHIQKLKMELIQKDMVKQSSLASLKALIHSDEISIPELKKLWKNGEQQILSKKR